MERNLYILTVFANICIVIFTLSVLLDKRFDLAEAMALSIIQIVLFYAITLSFKKYRSYFSIVYGTYLVLAHFGAIFFYTYTPQNVTLITGLGQFAWLESSEVAPAVLMSSVALGCLAVGTAVFTLSIRRKNGKSDVNTAVQKSNIREANLYVAALYILNGCTVFLLFAVATGRLPIGRGYSEYRDAISNLSGYPIFLLLLSISIAFAAATAPRQKLYIPFGIFLVPAFILFLTGNRGEVLFPLAGVVAALLSRGYRPNLSWILIGLSIFFIVIPFLQKTRETSAASNVQVTASSLIEGFADPFVEIGFTLRPLVDTLEWVSSGEKFSQGGSYLVPFISQLRKVSPHAFYTFDEEKNEIQVRESGKGYSVIAEAYFNFSIAGVCIIMLFIGYLLQKFAMFRDTTELALSAALLTILVNNLRNAFVFVPAHVFITVVIFYAVCNYHRLIFNTSSLIGDRQ